MSTPALLMAKTQTNKKVEEFDVQDLITSITMGRIMHNGKECVATWNQGFLKTGTEIDVKTKEDLVKAFSESTFSISARSNKTSPKVTVIIESSSSGAAASSSNTALLTSFNNMAANASAQSDITQILFSNARKHWTLNITDLAPSQAPLLNASTTAAATAAAPAKK